MSEVEHEEVASLLGAYALDAVELDERALVDRHLENCPRCRAELAEHQQVASVLGDTGARAPAGVWDRIAAQLDAEPAATAGPLPPLDLGEARRARMSRPARILASAAAVVLLAAVAGMGWIIADQRSRLDDLEAAMEGESVMIDPDAAVVGLADGTGTNMATAVVATNGRAVLIGTDLGRLADGRTYQLWAVGPDGPVSLGVLGPAPRVVPFGMVDDPSMVLAITDEPSGGSPAPTTEPMATGQMADV